MCYSNSSTSTTLQLAKRYKKEIDNNDFTPLYFANGFDFPKFRVITESEKIQTFQWGLIPNWYKGNWKDIASKTLNAKVETLYERNSFKQLISKKHCIIPSNGFYEWQTKGKVKTPFFITPSNDEFFSMIGLYDQCADMTTGEVYSSFTLITTEANSVMQEIHNTKKRMPLIIPSEMEADWLAGNTDSIFEFKFPSEAMTFHPVDKSLILRNVNAPETQYFHLENSNIQTSLF